MGGFSRAPGPAEILPIPDLVQALFAKAWSAAQGLAQAELAPQREALAQEQAALKADLARAQAENDEAVRILEVQLEHQAAQLAELATKEQAAQSRLAELAENLGYLKAKLEAAEGAEAVARQQLKDKEAEVVQLETRLQEAERGLKEATRPAKTGAK